MVIGKFQGGYPHVPPPSQITALALGSWHGPTFSLEKDVSYYYHPLLISKQVPGLASSPGPPSF